MEFQPMPDSDSKIVFENVKTNPEVFLEAVKASSPDIQKAVIAHLQSLSNKKDTGAKK